MKHTSEVASHATSQQQQQSSSPEKKINGDVAHDNASSLNEESITKEDEDGDGLISTEKPSVSTCNSLNPLSSTNHPTTAGSLQFYQDGKLVLKLQARKEEETYKWVKIKEWDPPKQPKRRKRYRKKLPKGRAQRARIRPDVLSSTDSEEEAKLKAKPKSFLLHRFKSTSLKQKERLLQNKSRTSTPSIEPSVISECSNQNSADVTNESSTASSSMLSIGHGSASSKFIANVSDQNILNFTDAVNCSYVNSIQRSSPLSSGFGNGKNGITAASLCRPVTTVKNHLTNGYYNNNSKIISNCNQILGSDFRYGNHSGVGSASSHNITSVTRSNYQQTLVIPSHKLRSTVQSPQHHFVVSPPMSQNSPQSPQLCSVPRQILPSFTSPAAVYEVPQFQFSTIDRAILNHHGSVVRHPLQNTNTNWKSIYNASLFGSHAILPVSNNDAPLDLSLKTKPP